ncbi:hypothetical protein GQX74_003435 [Glossina fuscipes]|nr:hypothetical protein GQX74_003435 [Glossina fuscipes]
MEMLRMLHWPQQPQHRTRKICVHKSTAIGYAICNGQLQQQFPLLLSIPTCVDNLERQQNKVILTFLIHLQHSEILNGGHTPNARCNDLLANRDYFGYIQTSKY